MVILFERSLLKTLPHFVIGRIYPVFTLCSAMWKLQATLPACIAPSQWVFLYVFFWAWLCPSLRIWVIAPDAPPLAVCVVCINQVAMHRETIRTLKNAAVPALAAVFVNLA
ncbi:MAG: hypothetical protein WHT82_10775, partial [Limisphaera sp.]